MFVFPAGAMAELAHNNWETQLKYLMSISNNLVGTSMRLSDLHLQVTRRLMEESADAFRKSMQIRTFADAQSFMAEQSQLAVERMRGYGQNVQNITSENWINLGKARAGHADDQAGQTAQASNDAGAKDSASHQHDSGHGNHGAHETDPRPSPLVDKLVASVVNDTDKLH